MIILKDAMDKYINKNKKNFSKEKIELLKFWSKQLDGLSTYPLINQILIYDIVTNIIKLKPNKYPNEVYEARGRGYLRCEATDDVRLSYFPLPICLFEVSIYRKDNVNIALMNLGMNYFFKLQGEIIFKNEKLYSTQDFDLSECGWYEGENLQEHFRIIRFAEHLHENWDCFKDAIFPEYLQEFPTDWDNYSQNKIVLMLKNMLKSE